MTKNEKLVKKIRLTYSFIFQDPILNPLFKYHFDTKGSFIIFLIALLEWRFEQNVTVNLFKVNEDEWIKLFTDLYKDTNIINFYKKLEINPSIPLEHIIEKFNLFDTFTNNFINLLKQHEINLNIQEKKLKVMIKNVFGYFLYNSVPYKIAYHFSDILEDRDYESKFLVVLYNTKLFALAKKSITDNCGNKINTIISIILGLNNSISKK